MKLFLEDAPDNLTQYLTPKLADFPESVEIGPITYLNDDSPQSRWEQLVLAAQGARLYSNIPERAQSPLYAGPLPKVAHEADLIPIDLNYAYKQAKYFKSFGVTYIGRTHVIPRTLLMLDHKRSASDRLDQTLPKQLEYILRDAPADWWGTMGIFSTSSQKRLEGLLNGIPDAIPMALTSGVNKIKFAGFECVHLNDPKPGPRDFRYGTDMRGRANDLSKKIAIEETGDWVDDGITAYVPDRSPSEVLDA